MERAVELFVAINCFVIGLSHLLQAPVWVDFFKQMRSFGKPGVFVNGLLSLTSGSIIVGLHWIWEGVLPTFITCFGLAQVIKGFVALVLPSVGLKSLHRPMAENPLGYQVGGVIFLAISAVLMYHLWM